MEEDRESRVRHLREVEGLSIRQIAGKLGMSRKTVSRILGGSGQARPPAPSIIAPYQRLIRQWYEDYPFLQARQVLERLRAYGFTGGYTTVKEHTLGFRRKRPEAYHELEFLPGEEAQVDWMHWTAPFGMAYGFVFLLACSRYLFARFYRRCSMEFFLDGHIEAMKETGGTARTNRYDNLKSVVTRRRPELALNPRFLDFARHYGFSIHACTPGRANEKGRVERAIRDIKGFLRSEPFGDLEEMNRKVDIWRRERNQRTHRSTRRPPVEMLKEEMLRPLPAIHYRPYREIAAQVSKTGFVEFETNRYSVPSELAGSACVVLAYPERLEIVIRGRKTAQHKRVLDRHTKVEVPSHREGLLRTTPRFKRKRIHQLMRGMDRAVELFLERAQQEGEDPEDAAHELFRLLLGSSKETLLSALREANALGIYRVKYIHGLIGPKGLDRANPVCPQDAGLLDIEYEGRQLKDYDELA